MAVVVSASMRSAARFAPPRALTPFGASRSMSSRRSAVEVLATELRRIVADKDSSLVARRTIPRNADSVGSLSPWWSPASSSTKPRHAGSAVRWLSSSESDAQSRLEETIAKDNARRLQDFKEMLREPDDIFIRGHEARKLFSLSRTDLSELGENYIEKDSPFDSHGTRIKQYPLKEVVQLAKRKYTEEQLLHHISSRNLSKYTDSAESDTSGHVGSATWNIYGEHLQKEETPTQEEDNCAKKMLLKKMYWYNAPSTTTIEGRASVVQGLKTNLGICTAKGAVWLGTGSHVMFADMMHSIADVLNYSYRLMELNRSSRSRDVFHPYGYAPLRYITADRSFVFLGFVGGVCPMLAGVSELMQAYSGSLPMGSHLTAVGAVFLISGVLEGVAVKTAYREILSLYAKELGDGPSKVQQYGLREVLQYVREGRDVMSTATFTEASSGVLASGIGVAGIGASMYLQSGAPDVAASMVMAAMVCGVSNFLLRKSGNALLGQTLPRWRVKDLVIRLEAHAAVVNVYDVKTEMIGTDTVRFKAEVQFNPQVITERMLLTMRDDGANHKLEGSTENHHAVITARLRQGVLTNKLEEVLVQLQQGVPVQADAEAWLYRNNNVFYEALAWELKDVEKVVRHELREFRNVHIDLEPW